MPGQGAHHGRDVGRATRTDEDDIDPGEHGAVERRRQREFDLAEEVDPDLPVMALLREEHLDEAGGHSEFLQPDRRSERVPGNLGEPGVRRDPALDEVGVEDPCRNLRLGEGRQGPADLAAGVAALQPASQQDVQRSPGDDPQLTGPRHRAGQPPVGDRNAHPPLDDRRAAGGRAIGYRCAGHLGPLPSQGYLRCRKLR